MKERGKGIITEKDVSATAWSFLIRGLDLRPCNTPGAKVTGIKTSYLLEGNRAANIKGIGKTRLQEIKDAAERD